ncbi:hypothetical protein DFA_08342 [Cavenderia fasciculata]|uniref:Actin-like ATPase domain-containing protein n=1 Tax=Cavenderia fasciculata TaxID=261658 RepID=F4Q5T8_CACFS|nr:uncharacterized protein DFA_08342 [Cavenderia fasciculata]EGG17347.1 hypothetical protein DFA_08342 [Cavenderia fasciculata]|eukprot:XP_004355831.1 hypothetical protein DFA_08342 [Cavenderia fasciculata]
MERFWNDNYYDTLRFYENEAVMIVSECTGNTPSKRDQTARIFFDTIKVVKLTFVNQQVAALYATGRTTGLLVDVGDTAIHIVPIKNSEILTEAVTKLNYGGRDVTNYLVKLINQQQPNTINSNGEIDETRVAKETLCKVAPNAATAAAATGQSGSFTLGDGQDVNLNNKQIYVGELLFNPSLNNIADSSLPAGIVESIGSVAAADRATMYNNIVLAGGSSNFPGLVARLQTSIPALAPPSTVFNIIAPANREHLAYTGISQLSTLPQFVNQSVFITKDQFNQNGNTVENLLNGILGMLETLFINQSSTFGQVDLGSISHQLPSLKHLSIRGFGLNLSTLATLKSLVLDITTIDDQINLSSQCQSLKKLVIHYCYDPPSNIIIPPTVEKLKIYKSTWCPILSQVLFPPRLTHLSIIGDPIIEYIKLPETLIKLLYTVRSSRFKIPLGLKKLSLLDPDNLNVLVLETKSLQGGIITQQRKLDYNNNNNNNQQQCDPIYLDMISLEWKKRQNFSILETQSLTGGIISQFESYDDQEQDYYPIYLYFDQFTFEYFEEEEYDEI